MSRANRPEWNREALLGSSVYDLFSDHKQRSLLKKVIASLVEGRLISTQTLEFDSGAKSASDRDDLSPVATKRVARRMLVQLQDVTRDHLNRIALLDRERRLREVQERVEAKPRNTPRRWPADAGACREVSELHEELERLSTEQRVQGDQLKKVFAAAVKRREEHHVRRVQEFAEIVASLGTAFGNPLRNSAPRCAGSSKNRAAAISLRCTCIRPPTSSTSCQSLRRTAGLS